jgi:hypothetical protein
LLVVHAVLPSVSLLPSGRIVIWRDRARESIDASVGQYYAPLRNPHAVAYLGPLLGRL